MGAAYQYSASAGANFFANGVTIGGYGLAKGLEEGYKTGDYTNARRSAGGIAAGIGVFRGFNALKTKVAARSDAAAAATESAPAVANAAGGEPITSVGVIRPGADPLPHQMGITPRTNNGGKIAPNTPQTFQGHDKPWTTGATPNSIYTHIDPKTGKAVQNAIYDQNGNVVGHVDFKNHRLNSPSGHGHTFPTPGNPGSGHDHITPPIPYDKLRNRSRGTAVIPGMVVSLP